ncbi:apoptosis-promoting RNA-binding protein TIA-1/TIAR, partial [Reticulomyxa filosa]
CVETLDKYEMKEWTEEKENNGKPLKLYVARSQKRTERDRTLQMNARRNRGRTTSPGNNLYVKPLAPDLTDDKLRELFGPFGNIISAKVMRNPETNQSRGFGFVCFETKEEASQALVKLNGSVIDGTKLYVSRAQKKEERQQFLATRARRTSSRQMYGGPMMAMPPYMPNPQVPPYYNYQRQGIPSSQPQMHPAQFAHTLPRPPYGYGQMQPMPLPMQMQSMGVPVNSVGQFGFPMRMQNPGFSGMPPNAGMQPQQPSSAAITGAVGSAAMRSGMGSVGAVSQGAGGGGGARGGQSLSASLGTGTSALGGPMSNYSQPTQPVAQAPQQHIFASAGQTGVEPAGQNRQAHSFPSQMSATERETQPLTPQMLNNATAQEKKRMIGERLFPKIQEVEPRLAGKITGMLLEMENTELLVLLNNKEQLKKN